MRKNEELEIKSAVEKGKVSTEELNRKLFIAASQGNPDLTEFLIKHGADVNCKDGRNITPIFHATADVFWSISFSNNNDTYDSLYGDKTITDLKTLIEDHKKQNYDAEYIKNLEAVMEDVTSRDYPRTVEILIKYGADVNAKTPNGYTVLDSLLENEDSVAKSKILKILIDNGALRYDELEKTEESQMTSN